MKRIYEFLKEHDIVPINEAFKSPILTAVAKAIKEYNMSSKSNSYYGKHSMRDIFRGYSSVRWPEVDDSNVKDYPVGTKDLTKAVRAILQNRADGIIFGFMDDKPTFAIQHNGDVILFSGAYNNSSMKFNRGLKQYQTMDFINDTSLADTIYVITFDKNCKIKTEDPDSYSSRWNAKQGIVRQGDADYYRYIAMENMERYRKIIAKNHVTNNKEDEALIKETIEALTKVNEIAQKAAKDPTAIDNMVNLQTLMEYAYGASYSSSWSLGNLLSKFIKRKDDIMKQTSGNWGRDEMKDLRASMRKKIDCINDYVQKIGI